MNITGAFAAGMAGNAGGVINANPFLIAHGQHTTDSFVNGVPVYWPGSHDPRQHNPLVDPAGNFIPGTAPKDSEIPLGLSSNLPAAKSINQSGSGIPGAAGNIAGQITADEKTQFAKQNPGSKSQIAGVLFQPGAGLFGGVRRLLG